MFKTKEEKQEFGRCPITGIKLSPVNKYGGDSFIKIAWRDGRPFFDMERMMIQDMDNYHDLYMAIASLAMHAAMEEKGQVPDPALYNIDWDNLHDAQALQA